MENREYQPPMLEVYEVTLEKGFAQSPSPLDYGSGGWL